MRVLDIQKLKDKDFLLIKVKNKKQDDSVRNELSKMLKDSDLHIKALIYTEDIMITQLVELPLHFLQLLERRVNVAVRLKEPK